MGKQKKMRIDLMIDENLHGIVSDFEEMFSLMMKEESLVKYSHSLVDLDERESDFLNQNDHRLNLC